MKILKYFFLVVFVLIYCAGILLDMTVTLYGGLGGPYQYLWIIPLHFILSTVFFAVYRADAACAGPTARRGASAHCRSPGAGPPGAGVPGRAR